MAAGTYRAQELAERLGISTWLLYKLVKDGSCPVPPIRLGKRLLVWPKAPVDRWLGIEEPAS